MPVIAALLAFFLTAASPAPSPALKASGPALAGVGVGSSILETVKLLGPPDLVATTDAGHEWRWVDAHGVDLDVLTDDDFIVQEAAAMRPPDVDGRKAPLVQPHELPLLEMPAVAATTAMNSLGAEPLREPEASVLAWRLDGGVAVAELDGGNVRRLVAMNERTAARLGYVEGPPPRAHHAPVLVNLMAVGYPPRAVRVHAEGVVVVRVSIDRTGRVQNTRVVLSSGNPDIDAAEVESMRRSTFRPARCEDVPCDGIYLDRESYEINR